MILDLFAGPGGWDEGLRSIGITDVIGMEWDDAACATRAAAGHKTVRCDVSQYPPEPFAGRVRGLIASPPCKAWTVAGNGYGRAEVDRVHASVEMCRNGWTDDARAGEWLDESTPLILEPLRWAWAIRPTWIALEQVKPALGVWEHMADVLRSWGYKADARILCAADYGVPQTRYRAILIAHRERLAWPKPTHAKNPESSPFGLLKPWVTMAEALGLAGPLVFCGNQNPPQFDGAYHRLGIDLPAQEITGNEDRFVWLRVGNQKNASRRRIDQPAPTIYFGNAMNDIGFVSHPDEQVCRHGRKIEVWEAGVLQGFPADYPWRGSKTAMFRQVGDAVPPPMAAAICGALEGVRAGMEAVDEE